jgi:hypothetical protein
LLLLATVAGFASVIVSGGHSVRLEASSKATVDDVFKITVFALAKTPINAVNIQVALPSEQFELLGVNRGESVLTLWTTDPYIENNVVYLEGGTFRKGFIGEHKIATLLVRPLRDGKSTITVQSASFYGGDGSGTVFMVSGLGGVEVVTYPADQSITDSAHILTVADLNNDGVLSISDISIFIAAWNRKDRVIDFDNDGKMTFSDFSILLSLYFKQNR